MGATWSRRKFLHAAVSGTPIAFANHDPQIDTELDVEFPATVADTTITFAGRLTRADTDTGLANHQVVLTDKDGGIFSEDDLDFRPNRLATTTTTQSGEFTLTWDAQQHGDSADVETYIQFPGTTTYAASQAPPTHHYPIRVTPDVKVYDFALQSLLFSKVLVQGQRATNYILPHTTNQFTAEPPESAPPIALQVTGLPAESYTISPAKEEPHITLPGIGLIRVDGRVFIAQLDMKTDNLSIGQYSVDVTGESVTMQRTQTLGAFQIVPPTSIGMRRHLYDRYARVIQPWWWGKSAQIAFASHGTMDPALTALQITVDTGSDILTDRSLTNIVLESFKLLIDRFQTVRSALDVYHKYMNVREILRTAATAADVKPAKVGRRLHKLGRAVAADQATPPTAHDERALLIKLSVVENHVQAWQDHVTAVTINAPKAERQALDLLNSLREFVANERSRIVSPRSTPSDWQMFGGGPAHTGAASNATGPTPPITRKWVFTPQKSVQTNPAVVNGSVYVTSADGRVYALDTSTGDLVWESPFTQGRDTPPLTPDGVSSPVIVNGTVYVGLENRVYAINAHTGTAAWETPFQTPQGKVQSTPAVVDGTVYVGSTAGKLYALDAATGEAVWEQPFQTKQSEPVSSPTVVDDTIYIGSLDRHVYAVTTDTGELVWDEPFKTSGQISTSPAVVDNVLYLQSGPLVGAIDLPTRNVMWSFKMEAPLKLESSPTVSNNHLYIGSDSGHVYALDTTSGEEVWDQPFTADDAVYGSPAVANGTVYIGSADQHVYGIDAATGKLAWKQPFTIGAQVHSSPTVADTTLYVGSHDGVYALE